MSLNICWPVFRDRYGHFCDTILNENDLQCASVQEKCELFLDNSNQSCPSTCLECPTWHPANPSTLWYILMLVGLLSPLSVWIFIPFLRGQRKREDHFYGLFSISKLRLFAICGLPDEQHPIARSYDHVKIRRESYDSNDVLSSRVGTSTAPGRTELLTT
jgi:hypothetical protein